MGDGDVLVEAREALNPKGEHLYGPWDVDWDHPADGMDWAYLGYPVWADDGDLVAVVAPSGGHYLAHEMGEFIAAAPDLVSRLADEVERLRDEVRSLEDQEVGAAICCNENEAAIERVRAFARDCVEHGDMTPAAALMLNRVLDGGEQ